MSMSSRVEGAGIGWTWPLYLQQPAQCLSGVAVERRGWKGNTAPRSGIGLSGLSVSGEGRDMHELLVWTIWLCFYAKSSYFDLITDSEVRKDSRVLHFHSWMLLQLISSVSEHHMLIYTWAHALLENQMILDYLFSWNIPKMIGNVVNRTWSCIDFKSQHSLISGTTTPQDEHCRLDIPRRWANV